MTKYLPFVYDKGSFFTNQKCFIITGEHLSYLTAFLNSKLFRFAFREYFPELLGDTRELSKIFFENVTVKPIDNSQNHYFSNLINEIVDLKINGKDFSYLENEIEKSLSEIYILSTDERNLINSSM
jgi:hypothetical protein